MLGSAAGLAAAMWWTPTLQALLFQIGPRDTATFAAATGFVLVLVVAASLAPTLRATRVDPVATLRAE
jgi:ABC-type lipoprotein release transport system permease subunit